MSELKSDSSKITGSTMTAAEQAAVNWNENQAALKKTQPEIPEALGQRVNPGEWVYGRDGALTALDEEGKWLAGCSLPHLAAQSRFKELKIEGSGACFLNPVMAAQIRVALEKLKPEQVMMVVVPEVRTLNLMLQCETFAEAIGKYRLWFAWGNEWTKKLEGILESHPGLAIPGQFIRIPGMDEEMMESAIADARKVISEQGAKRAELHKSIMKSDAKSGPIKRLCILCSSRFRLWDESSAALAEITSERALAEVGLTAVNVDSDAPLMQSPVALAMVARDCDAMITSDVGRVDMPEVLPIHTPWITWVTTPRIPTPPAGANRDVIVLADAQYRDKAVELGWPAQRIHVAGWPVRNYSWEDGRLNHPLIAIIANTSAMEPPKRIKELSSHSLLWESIKRELRKDPFVVGEDLNAYLSERMKRMEISEEGFDRRSFLEGLIVPAYQQGVAGLLVKAGLPVRIWGEGWDQMPELKACIAGPVRSRDEFLAAIGQATVLVHVWPTSYRHCIETFGVPVLRRQSRSRETFVCQARAMLRGEMGKSKVEDGGLSAGIIREICGKISE